MVQQSESLVFQLRVVWSDGVVWGAENLVRLSLWGRILLCSCDWSLRLFHSSRAVVVFIMHKILVVLLILRDLPFGQQVKYASSVFWKECEYEYVKRAWLVQFGFATRKCHRARGGERVVMVLQEKDLPGYFWIDKHLC